MLLYCTNYIPSIIESQYICRNDTLSVTLWDKFATEFDDNQFLQVDTNVPIIVVFSSMSIRTYKGKPNFWIH